MEVLGEDALTREIVALSTAELTRIVGGELPDYGERAAELARAELQRRGHPVGDVVLYPRQPHWLTPRAIGWTLVVLAMLLVRFCS